ncbi:MAG: A24 family peptidase [Propionibacterium sp.]|nr:A24 family peptidase [Propionibacterium sp.]
MSVPSAWGVPLVAAAVPGALALGAWGWWRLRSTPEPAGSGESGGWVKPRYDVVADRAMLAQVLALAGVLSTAAVLARPAGTTEVAWLPAALGWAMMAGLGSAAVLCDLRTTYLPSSLMRPWELLTALAVLASWSEALVSDPGHTTGLVVRVGVGALAARLLFWGLWHFGGRVGYGDVRLATILAADAALVSVTAWTSWLVAGTLTGGVWAIATAIVRRRRPTLLGTAFPYGPSLAIGAWLALVLQ